MTTFNHYARYYDLLYKDKDYAVEADYVFGLLRANRRDCQTILELGSGTGGHAEHLAQKGIAVHGIDLSGEMVEKAEVRKAALSTDIAKRLSYAQGDVRDYRNGQQYDAVVSLFHVMSYQPTNADLVSAFKTAHEHLKPGGIFIFDCWYGPAVLTDRPTVRIKRMEDEAISVTRLAEPVLHANENCVTVNYTILIRNKQNDKVDEISESHKMRYLFVPELYSYLDDADFVILSSQEWGTAKELGADTWSATIIAQNVQGGGKGGV